MEEREVTWSSFLRNPTRVDAWLKNGDVVLRRRDGEALRLSRARGDEAEKVVLAAAAEVLTLLLPSGHARLAEPTRQMPWTRFLPEADRRLFVEEFVQCLDACAGLGGFSPVVRLLADWKKTALLHAEGLADQLRRPIRAAGGSVKRP
jgi:hypothetical protein